MYWWGTTNYDTLRQRRSYNILDPGNACRHGIPPKFHASKCKHSWHDGPWTKNMLLVTTCDRLTSLKEYHKQLVMPIANLEANPNTFVQIFDKREHQTRGKCWEQKVELRIMGCLHSSTKNACYCQYQESSMISISFILPNNTLSLYLLWDGKNK